MRIFALLPLAFLLAGCLAPGQRDPTRYPWDSRNAPSALHPPVVARGAIPPLVIPQPQPRPPNGIFCVIALIPPNTSGITVGAKAPGIAACSTPAIAPSTKWHN
jgi:hypothetical protein